MARRRGFTLLELLVALAIVALLAALLGPGVPRRAFESMQYHATVRAMLAGMKSARLEAERRGEPTVFTVDLRARRFGVNERLASPLPDGFDVRAVVAGREVAPDGRAAIRFYPEGGATGGSIELLRPSGTGIRLRVDWLLGRVTQEPAGP